MILSETEVRVLGALVEKSWTTPEYYPMSPNAVMNACNQKSSREPVVSFNETVVIHALFSLRDKKLVWEKSEDGSRVTKYGHHFKNIAPFSEAEEACLCLLMLRGPQTSGEIKTRSGRLHEFASPAEVESTLHGLMTHSEKAFVTKLARQTGHKEARFAHLLCGETSRQPSLAKETVLPTRTLEQRAPILEEQATYLSKTVSELKNRNPTPR